MRPILLLSIGPGGSGETSKECHIHPQGGATHPTVFSLTVIFAFHKALPLPEPLHADAQDDPGGLLCLELFVELQTGNHQGDWLRNRRTTVH